MANLYQRSNKAGKQKIGNYKNKMLLITERISTFPSQKDEYIFEFIIGL